MYHILPWPALSVCCRPLQLFHLYIERRNLVKPISLRPVIPTSKKDRLSTLYVFLSCFCVWYFIFLCFILKPCIWLEKEFSGFRNRRHMTDFLVIRLWACLPGDRFSSRLQHNADLSPPSNPKVKSAFSYTTAAPWVFMAWYLTKYRYFTLFYFTDATNHGLLYR